MAWLQKLTGRTRKAESTQVEFPVQLELIPEKLSARVHLNDIDSRDGAVPCWTYVTNGLRTHGQKELIFSLRRDSKEKAADFPRAPLEFFTQVYHFAEQGRLVDVGDISEMATPSFLGRKGLLYISPASCQNIEGLEAALTAILLTEEELSAVKKFGPTRVVARLGQASRYYPCPPWSDRRRPGLSFSTSFQESILAKVPTLWTRGIRVRLENDVIAFGLLPKISGDLRDQLDQIPLDRSLALLTNLDPSADGCLVWEPGCPQPSAITPPNSTGTRLCGCFILFVPDQPQDVGMIFEDGFGMMLTNASWAVIRQAIATGEAVSIPATDEGMDFQLEWIPTSYYNPVEDAVWHAEAGWEAYVPADSQDHEDDEGFFRVERIVLLMPQSDLAVRVGVEPFAAYTRAIEKTVRECFAPMSPIDGLDLVVQFEVWPSGKVEVGFAHYPGIANEVLEGLRRSLLALSTPTVSQASIKFQIAYAIWGGSGASDRLGSSPAE